MYVFLILEFPISFDIIVISLYLKLRKKEQMDPIPYIED